MSIYGDRTAQGSFEDARHVQMCGTCNKEIFPAGCLPGVGYYRSNYCECTKVQRPQVPMRPGEAESLRTTAARWFEHPSPITQCEREMQYQAYKARLMLELGLSKERQG
jgi:hypothetical protein